MYINWKIALESKLLKHKFHGSDNENDFENPLSINFIFNPDSKKDENSKHLLKQ